jgi:hypothetical protein
MSGQGLQAVRHPLDLAADSRRRPEERLALRLPYLQVIFSRVWTKLPPQSRMRRAIVPRIVRAGFEAANRGDLELTFANYDRGVQFFPPTPRSRISGRSNQKTSKISAVSAMN